jgi:uncharacterized membrane protein YphA (DoxX/SURF4 family)
MSINRLPPFITMTLLAIVTTVLALFFLFVGYMKAVAPLAELAQHHAWTVHLIEPLGRAVGWSEIGCALLLVVGLFRPTAGRIGAAVLLVNQIAAAAVHISVGEIASLPQNAVIILLCLLVWHLQSSRKISARAA